MTDEMPDIQITPRAVISHIGGVGTMWVVESFEEVEAQMKELRERLHGIAEEDDPPGLKVTGIDLTTLDGKITTPTYQTILHPGFVTQVREVTPEFWEHHMRTVKIHADAETQQAEGPAPTGYGDRTNPIVEALQAMGFPIKEAVFPSGGKPMTSDEYRPEIDCCCGHNAEHHVLGGQQVEECTQCACKEFHTHPEREG